MPDAWFQLIPQNGEHAFPYWGIGHATDTIEFMDNLIEVVADRIEFGPATFDWRK